MSALPILWTAFLQAGPPQGPTWDPATWPSWAIPAILAAGLLLVVIILKLQELPSRRRAKNRSVLDPEQLEGLMTSTPPQIVDLRPREEFQGKLGHIRGALNIPFAEFAKRSGELDTSHPRPIVLVDETDKLSHEAMTFLEQKGHRWLYVLKGGYRAWRRSKYPVYHLPQPPKKK